MSDDSVAPVETTDTTGVLPAADSTVKPGRRRRRVLAGLDSPFATGIILTFGALFAIVMGLALGSLATILIYITLALFAAIGLDPVVRRLERHGVARAWGITIVFGIFALILIAVVVFVIPPVIQQLVELAKSIPAAITQFEASDTYKSLQADYGDILGKFTDQVKTALSDPTTLANLGGGVFAFTVGLATAISGGLIIVVLTLYFLASMDSMKSAMYQLAPARNRAKVADLTDRITSSMGGYLMGMTILASINAVIATILHLVLGLPFPALMGLLAFLITLIPLIGSVLYWLTATAIALFTNPVAALTFAIIYLIYIQIEAYVLTPRVMNKAISVPGALVVIGALVGGSLLGLLGALVAIPVTAAILLIIKEVFIPRQDAKRF